MQHNSHFNPTSYTTKASDWQLYFSVECATREQAKNLESFIKKMKNRTFYAKLKTDESLVKDLLNRFLV